MVTYSISARRGRLAPQLTLAFGALSGTYADMGVVLYPARTTFLNNLTDVTVTFTQDTSEDEITLGSGQAIAIDWTTNKTTDNGLFNGVGLHWYAKGAGASSGAVYVTYTYGQD